MLIKNEEEIHFFICKKRDSWIQMRKILSHTTLVMLERTMHLAMIMLLVKYRFQNPLSDGTHNAKVPTVN